MTWLVRTLEQVVAAFLAAFVASASALPGGIWSSDNWKVAAVAAAGIALKSVLGRYVGDKNSPALLPLAAEAGTKFTLSAATGAVENGVSKTIGRIPVVGPAVDETVTAVDNVVEDVGSSVVGNAVKLVSGLGRIFRRR